jgi:hypothetical protein
MLAHTPSKTHLNGVESVKAIFDSRQNTTYIIRFQKEQLEYLQLPNQFSHQQ